jgi:hypothetical protein
VPSPLAAVDPDRAHVLTAKIRDRISDVRRHLVALRVAMSEFGEDFDADAFTDAFASTEPEILNRVKAVERGVDQLFNYIAELTAFGLELACVRDRMEDTNARRDLDRMRERGLLSGELVTRLQRLRELRRLLVHEYAGAAPDEIREAALLVANDFPVFYDAYLKWVRADFVVREPRGAGRN